MSDEEYRPRPDDHLVEPFFEGLGHRASPPPQETEPGADERVPGPHPPGSWWRRLLARLRPARGGGPAGGE